MRYLFEDCTIDTGSRELRRGTALVPVEPQVFDLLVYLIRHRARVVSKDDMLASIWQGRIVSESALFNRINAARGAIGDSGGRQRLIRTLPRKGVRFVGEVREDGGSAIALSLPDRPSLAVLPFANTSGDLDQEHVADGISEDLITGLARIRWLFVISRSSTFAYKGRAIDVKRVARELGVRYVLEGSVRRAGGRLRVSAQLTDASTGAHHWAERYDRDVDDIFAVQDEITSSVAAAIEPRLMAAEGVRTLARASTDLGCWERVARAQTHFWRLTREDCAAAIEALEAAVAGFPDDAPARGLLGFCMVFAVHMGWLDRAQGLPAGRRHAIRAIALDHGDPWGHIGLGYVALMEKSTEEALTAFRRAVVINPNSALGLFHLSHGLAFAGHDQEAIAHAEQAIRLSPLDPMMAQFLGAIAVAHYVAGRFAEAHHYTTEAVRLRPSFQGAQRMRCAALARMGRIDEARAVLADVRLEQPGLSLDWVRANVPYQTPELMEAFLQGMRRAGL